LLSASVTSQFATSHALLQVAAVKYGRVKDISVAPRRPTGLRGATEICHNSEQKIS